MFTFLLIFQTIVAVALVAVILMQRSEGGGLGVGGSSSGGGLMTARGAADFLTRSTAILGGIFIFLSIALAAIAGVSGEAPTVDTSLAAPQPTQPVAPAPTEAPAVPLAQ
ncbi:preprotein translocase subunit SecG [Sphingomonas xanthus]|uniref:Protein-export membrane protein SecG n=1 Tax=Sphingomonas xanthus TaxID=2594473 RepID=A0A516ITY6_9SPHN|nr:preprotein translocase subunit SecG [Sphingomonas xanthus]QDP20330.1 preprotein translocase subunit SecG [Sphingomonas xanthus]